MAKQSENAEDQDQLVVFRKQSGLREAEGHAKMMIVGAGARFLFYPTLFYNLVRNRLQSEFRWWDEIDQFLLLGAVPFPRDIPRLKDVGVHAVVTLNESYETLVHTSLYKNQGISHLVIPTRDYLFAPSFADLSRAVQFIHAHAVNGKRTYVHCKAGRGRSTTVVICYLVEHRGMTPLEALHHVRARRPRVLLAASQWQAVQNYSKQCKLQRQIARSSVASAASNDEVEDLPVLVSKNDLVGYRSIEDAGLIGNEMWLKDIGILCRLRLLAARKNMNCSSAWSKLSGFWVSSSQHSRRRLIATSATTTTEASSAATCKQMASSCAFCAVPVYQSGMVN